MEKFNYVIEVGASMEEVFHTNRLKFGDGYEQSTAVGLKNQREVWSVYRTTRKPLAMEILGFLNRHKEVNTFLWDNPFGEEILVKATDIKLTGPDGGGNYKVSARFTQEV